MQLDQTQLKKQLKKLKNHKEEEKRLEQIIELIVLQIKTYNDLYTNSFLIMYGFEELKHELSGYYSYNLCKARTGKIRLIMTIGKDFEIIYIEYISTDHYKDFKRKLK